ncbi:MAG: 16S rRNA (cytidine(1402)-2'-O)-methyltransferase [Candidatus Bipolaricaulota bacterium]|nr:16S rRNA (cytidine(1402)-2'-O)-methyltransferase [Candidatus Bipolaricaulota bacterium]
MLGTLYVVSTPIGNLEDITLRALRVLREADLIVGEDTRRTRGLLAHYGIGTPFAPSLYEGVERERTEGLLRLLREGKRIALVSDAGTPLLSDPGYPLVRACAAEGIPVVPIPGASALLAALVASGLPTDRFLFGGYLPRQPGPRRRALEELLGVGCTAVVYESPRRVRATLEELANLDPNRPVVVARELTKVHEEFVRGTAAEVAAALAARGEVRGEVALLVGPGEAPPPPPTDPEAVRVRYAELLAAGNPPREALRKTAVETGVSRREVYRIVHAEGAPTEAPGLTGRIRSA